VWWELLSRPPFPLLLWHLDGRVGRLNIPTTTTAGRPPDTDISKLVPKPLPSTALFCCIPLPATWTWTPAGCNALAAIADVRWRSTTYITTFPFIPRVRFTPNDGRHVGVFSRLATLRLRFPPPLPVIADVIQSMLVDPHPIPLLLPVISDDDREFCY